MLLKMNLQFKGKKNSWTTECNALTYTLTFYLSSLYGNLVFIFDDLRVKRCQWNYDILLEIYGETNTIH